MIAIALILSYRRNCLVRWGRLTLFFKIIKMIFVFKRASPPFVGTQVEIDKFNVTRRYSVSMLRPHFSKSHAYRQTLRIMFKLKSDDTRKAKRYKFNLSIWWVIRLELLVTFILWMSKINFENQSTLNYITDNWLICSLTKKNNKVLLIINKCRVDNI